MYETEYIELRNLKEGDRFLTKGDSECIYMYPLGDDKHRIRHLDGDSWDVPNGNFPIFKYKGDE